jgi:hypothetical protein
MEPSSFSTAFANDPSQKKFFATIQKKNDPTKEDCALKQLCSATITDW